MKFYCGFSDYISISDIGRSIVIPTKIPSKRRKQLLDVVLRIANKPYITINWRHDKPVFLENRVKLRGAQISVSGYVLIIEIESEDELNKAKARMLSVPVSMVIYYPINFLIDSETSWLIPLRTGLVDALDDQCSNLLGHHLSINEKQFLIASFSDPIDIIDFFKNI